MNNGVFLTEFDEFVDQLKDVECDLITEASLETLVNTWIRILFGPGPKLAWREPDAAMSELFGDCFRHMRYNAEGIRHGCLTNDTICVYKCMRQFDLWERLARAVIVTPRVLRAEAYRQGTVKGGAARRLDPSLEKEMGRAAIKLCQSNPKLRNSKRSLARQIQKVVGGEFETIRRLPWMNELCPGSSPKTDHTTSNEIIG